MNTYRKINPATRFRLCSAPKRSYLLLIYSLFLFIFNYVGASAFAQTTYYVLPEATGSANGSDWTNAFSELSAPMERGAIYYIGDGSYGSCTLDDPTSGSSYITIQKATNKDHGTDVGWDDTYGDGEAVFSGFYITTSYWIIDGSIRGSDWKAAYGIKIDTLNGNDKGLRVPGGSDVSHITVKYVYFLGGGPDGSSRSNDLVYSLSTGSDFLFQYCYFYNSGRTHFLIRYTDSSTVEYCYFYLNESTTEQHSESFSCLEADSWTIRNNIFDTIEGTGVLMVGNGGGWKVYGNVFYNYESGANGIFAGWTAEYLQSGYFYNNTIVDSNYARIGFTNDEDLVVKNNIFIDNTKVLFDGEVTHDFNSYSGTNGYGETNSETGLTKSIFEDSDNMDYRLSSETAEGDNTIDINYVDISGNYRGVDGILDRGAYEYSGIGRSSLESPENLRVLKTN